jgi:hypothetical protein
MCVVNLNHYYQVKMETLYETDKLVVSYDSATNTLITRWSMPEDVNLDIYKAEFVRYKDYILEKRPDKIFADTIHNRITITPDLQEWINTIISDTYQAVGLKKLAVLLSTDFYAALSIQQTIEDDTKAKYKTAFFEDETKAFEWLNK